MIGDLLGASRSLFFVYHRAGAGLDIENGGFVNVRNAKVAENNSPLPQDRVSFRYNYFHNALTVGGVGSGSTPGLPFPVGIDQTGQFIFFTPQQGVLANRSFNVDTFTFGLEKTWWDGLFSTEVRVPFSRTLGSNQNLSAGNVTGIDPQGFLAITSTPENTLGQEDTEFGDITLIFKALLHRSSRLVVSGGLGLTFPTADDTSVQVRDFFGFVASDATGTRIRTFDIENKTYEIAPYLAALYTPSDRFFVQGFSQISVPAGRNRVIFTERTENDFLEMDDGTLLGPGLPPFRATSSIDEQTLMHLDLGVGYWLVRDPDARWITGIIPTLELHYTTTLEDANLVALPGDELVQQTRPLGPDPIRVDGFRDEPVSVVGNRSNRVDILNLTVGTTVEVANRATIATGFAFPLRRESDRTFDWEFQLQFNYYFGGPRTRPAPNF